MFILDVMESGSDPQQSRKNQELLHQETLKCLKRLVTQGKSAYPQAQFLLAECYGKKKIPINFILYIGSGQLGLSLDHAKAYQLYLSASKQSHPASTYRCAVCYELGAGTKRDIKKSFQFYRKAAALGDTPAMFKLGMVLKQGDLGQPKNARECLIWLKRAARQADKENPHALHELAVLYEGGVQDMEHIIIAVHSHLRKLIYRIYPMLLIYTLVQPTTDTHPPNSNSA